jgi:hypothetical protein
VPAPSLFSPPFFFSLSSLFSPTLPFSTLRLPLHPRRDRRSADHNKSSFFPSIPYLLLLTRVLLPLRFLSSMSPPSNSVTFFVRSLPRSSLGPLLSLVHSMYLTLPFASPSLFFARFFRCFILIRSYAPNSSSIIFFPIHIPNTLFFLSITRFFFTLILLLFFFFFLVCFFVFGVFFCFVFWLADLPALREEQTFGPLRQHSRRPWRGRTVTSQPAEARQRRMLRLAP